MARACSFSPRLTVPCCPRSSRRVHDSVGCPAPRTVAILCNLQHAGVGLRSVHRLPARPRGGRSSPDERNTHREGHCICALSRKSFSIPCRTPSATISDFCVCHRSWRHTLSFRLIRPVVRRREGLPLPPAGVCCFCLRPPIRHPYVVHTCHGTYSCGRCCNDLRRDPDMADLQEPSADT